MLCLEALFIGVDVLVHERAEAFEIVRGLRAVLKIHRLTPSRAHPEAALRTL
jgi:hypothetical protein